MALRANLWYCLLIGVVVLLEALQGTFKLDSMIPPGFSAPQSIKILHQSREPLTNTTKSNTATPSSLAESSSSNNNSRWRTPRNLIGSWIGDCWIPPSPEWRLYSSREMQDIFLGKRIAFVGDSLARRLAMTLFPILNHSMGGTTQRATHSHFHDPLEEDIPLHWIDNPRDLALNRRSPNQEPCNEYQWNGRHSPRICRTVAVDVVGSGNASGLLEPAADARSTETTMPPQPGQVWLIWDPCFPDLLEWFRNELRGTTNVTEGLDIVVVAAGIHDLHAAMHCHDDKPWQPSTNASDYYEELTQVLLERLDLVLQTLSELQRAKPHLTIVWKTSGYCSPVRSAHEKEKLVDRMNERAMDLLDQQQENATAADDDGATGDARLRTIQYFHWGGAVKARSFGDSRIKGDTNNHYGVEARLVALQMLTNVLAAQEK